MLYCAMCIVFFLFLIFFSDSLISDRSTPTLAQDVSSIQGNPGDKDTCPRCGGMVRTVLWLKKNIQQLILYLYFLRFFMQSECYQKITYVISLWLVYENWVLSLFGKKMSWVIRCYKYQFVAEIFFRFMGLKTPLIW